MTSKNDSLWGKARSWLGDLFAGKMDTNRVFGEEGFESQIETHPVCPRTGIPVDGTHGVAPCPMDDGSCSGWSEKGVHVPCMRLRAQQDAAKPVG